MNILLVCGSRSLATRAVTRGWVEESLHSRITGTMLVVAGDAIGPDVLAHEMALNRRIQCARWCVDGRVQYRFLDQWYNEARWDSDATTADPRRRPLERNAAMVAWCARRLAEASGPGDVVRALGLVDEGSPTRGTDHTLRLCERVGIPVERKVWQL